MKMRDSVTVKVEKCIGGIYSTAECSDFCIILVLVRAVSCVCFSSTDLYFTARDRMYFILNHFTLESTFALISNSYIYTQSFCGSIIIAFCFGLD